MSLFSVFLSFSSDSLFPTPFLPYSACDRVLERISFVYCLSEHLVRRFQLFCQCWCLFCWIVRPLISMVYFVSVLYFYSVVCTHGKIANDFSLSLWKIWWLIEWRIVITSYYVFNIIVSILCMCSYICRFNFPREIRCLALFSSAYL